MPHHFHNVVLTSSISQQHVSHKIKTSIQNITSFTQQTSKATCLDGMAFVILSKESYKQTCHHMLNVAMWHFPILVNVEESVYMSVPSFSSRRQSCILV
jgi:hypothetical protein